MKGGSLPALADTLARQWGAGDPPILRISRRRSPSPARRSGFPPGERGSSWHPPFSLPKRTADRRIPFKTEQNESSRGLSEPVGIHLSFALGLSNEVGPLQTSSSVASMSSTRRDGRPPFQESMNDSSSTACSASASWPILW